MSKITNDGLMRFGMGCFIFVILTSRHSDAEFIVFERDKITMNRSAD